MRGYDVSNFEQVWCFQLSTSQEDDSRHEEHQLFRGCHMILPQGVYIALWKPIDFFSCQVFMLTNVSVKISPPIFETRNVRGHRNRHLAIVSLMELYGSMLWKEAWNTEIECSREVWKWILGLKLNFSLTYMDTETIHWLMGHSCLVHVFCHQHFITKNFTHLAEFWTWMQFLHTPKN